MVNYLTRKLREHYNVCAASNGNEALQKIKGGAVVPDLIISDVMMDKLNGYDFMKIISKYPSYNHIPVIFLSAKSTSEDKMYGLSLGAIDFLQKPFKIDELLKKAESILTNANKQKEAVISSAIRKLSNGEDFKLNQIDDLFRQNCDLYKLTSRERDIVKLICQGHKYKVIAETLFISEKTVAKHVQNIFEKLEVSNKVELINKLDAA